MKAALVGLVALFGSAPTLAQDTVGDPEAGHQMVARVCQTCHGMDGNTGGARTPHIGGQPAAYLAEQLRAYRSGERENYIMNAFAKDLTDEQIEDVAAWYASHTATPVPPEGYSTAAAPEQCFGCHGANGIARAEGTPNLVGHSRVYLEAQMHAFRSGERESETMTPLAQRLSDEELAEVVEWYSSIGLEVSGP
jgi:cytochrome c553